MFYRTMLGLNQRSRGVDVIYRYLFDKITAHMCSAEFARLYPLMFIHSQLHVTMQIGSYHYPLVQHTIRVSTVSRTLSLSPTCNALISWHLTG